MVRTLLLSCLFLPVFVACSDDSRALEDVAVVETNLGTFEFRFLEEIAPLAVANFKGLTERRYYDHVTFHRVIKGFMIQCGDSTGTGRGGESFWGTPFPDEYDPSVRFDRAGRVAMVNAGPNTNGSQFFIPTAPTPHLNDHHTIFGEVTKGMDVVVAISCVATGQGDRPLEPVVMLHVSIEKRRATSEEKVRNTPLQPAKVRS